ncbi:histidine kinase [Micromonospora sp. KC213]|uniref:sensor histidine kinase n=1 Tax=Micromonospora sp. KC213 TaxID=2530378 RepID=UPI00104988E9|nr:histidine kinase [Micromonospora sp. KC213]TDC41530.1 histidine kinase [Micromonospora sp. KC213]
MIVTRGGWFRRSPAPPWALCVVALLLAVIVVDHRSLSWWMVVGAVFAPLAALVTLRAYPLISLATCAVTSLASGLAIHDSVPVWSAALGAALFMTSLLAGRRAPQPLPALAVLAVAAVLGIVHGLITGGGWGTGLLMLALVVALPWALGRIVRQQDQLVMMSAEQARLQERARIARDMHDTLGHELSLLALRAGALEMAPGLDERHRAAATELRCGAGTATRRLAEIITVLRDGAPAPLEPVNDRIEELVERARQAGVTVSLDRDGGEGLPPGVDRAAHRVVQEALTNAMKHAPTAPVRVRVSTTDGTTTVTVTNPLPPGLRRGPGSNAGLAGLRERVRLAGGAISAGPRGEQFELVAVLPHRGES